MLTLDRLRTNAIEQHNCLEIGDIKLNLALNVS